MLGCGRRHAALVACRGRQFSADAWLDRSSKGLCPCKWHGREVLSDAGVPAARPDRALEDSLMLELDPVAFTSGAGVQDEVPIARQRKLLGVVDRCAAQPPCPANPPHPCQLNPRPLH